MRPFLLILFRFVLIGLFFWCLTQRTTAAVAGSVPAVAQREHVQRVYLSQLGIREQTGNNDGAAVEMYRSYAGNKSTG